MDICNYIITVIKLIKTNRPVLVAFDGVDTSGKTTLADNIYQSMMSDSLLSPVRISIDKFHNPKHIRIQKGELSPEGFYSDSFNYDAILNYVITPVKNFDKYILTGVFDYKNETVIESNKIYITKDTVVLFDGIFMNRNELYKYWDLSIFLDISFETVIKRATARDTVFFGSRDAVLNKYNNRYIPGQKIYFDECQPKERADIVIDNNDYNNPSLIKKWEKGLSRSKGNDRRGNM